MGLFRPDAGPFLLERRTARRWRATCAATLQTLTDEYLGQLWDLSETGARLKVESTPSPGATAMLNWGDCRVRCSVVWATDGMCGVVFERPLDGAAVSATTQLLREHELPIATIGNIRVGRKRSDPNRDLGLLTPALETGPSRLVISLQRRPGLRGTASQASRTAGEEMFFFGSPLAHVLSY